MGGDLYLTCPGGMARKKYFSSNQLKQKMSKLDSYQILNSWDWRVEHENGTGSAKSEINVVLSRFDIGRETSCRVNSSATKVGGMQQVSSKKILFGLKVTSK